MENKIVIDVGSCYTKIYKHGVDVVLHEPTVIAVTNNNYKKALCGDDAMALLNKPSDNVKFIYPISSGEVKDEKALFVLLSNFIKKLELPPIMKYALVVSNLGAQRTSLKKIENILNLLKIYKTDFIESPILTYIQNSQINSYKDQVIVDLGGGKTTVCALNVEGIIAGFTAEYGGNNLTSKIITHVQDSLGLNLTFTQADELKIYLSSLSKGDNTKRAVMGKDSYTGRSRSMLISASQIENPVKEYADKIVDLIRLLLNKLSSETLAQISENGITLCGAGSGIYGLIDYLSLKLGFKFNVIKESDLSAVMGGGKIINDKKLLTKFKLNML